MTHHSYFSAEQRAVLGRYRRLLVLAVAGLASASACIPDVEIPPCLETDTCGQAGAGSGGSGQAGAESVAGESSFGGDGSGAGCSTCSISPAQLPSGCQGQPYEARLTVQDGEAPYLWQLTPPVAGWSIASRGPNAAVVEASVAPPGATTLKVTVTDARGLQKVATLNMRARSSCWFAYTALEGEEGKLRLVDPILDREIVPAHNDAVYDFQFSPDGKKLVYSYGASIAAPFGTGLSLVDIASQTEQALAIEADSIHSFAWSPDATTLAVAFQAGAVSKLGAVRLPASAGSANPAVLSAIDAHVEQDLSWVGNDFVAYHAQVDLDASGVPTPNPDLLHTPFYAKLGSAGFEPEVVTKPRFASNVSLRATDGGFYMLTNRSPPTQFFPLGGVTMTPRGHEKISLLAPSGKYSAILLDNEPLTFLSAEQGFAGVPAATARKDDTCQLVLAWAAGAKERLACVVDVINPDETYHGEVRFFDLPAQGKTLEVVPLSGHCEDDATLLGEASCAKREQKYSYGVGQARNAARAFSPSGAWFAFTRIAGDDGDTYLYLSKLSAQEGAFQRKVLIPADGESSRPSALSFSRDERFLQLQRGHSLWLIELEGTRQPYLWEEPLGLTDDEEADCVEEFADAPAHHCGDTERSAPFAWSPDSKSLAFRSQDALVLKDITSLTEIHAAPPLTARDCGEACSRRFAFQPQLAAP